MRRVPMRRLRTICLALAMVASTVLGATCPDAANNAPGCQFDSTADYLTFHLQDAAGMSSFDSGTGHAGPGSLAMAETTTNSVSVTSDCFDLTGLAEYHFGAHLRLAPPTTIGNCQVCLYLYAAPACSAVDLIVCKNLAALGSNWNRLEEQVSTLGLPRGNFQISCSGVSDGGIVQVDDVFAGSTIFFDTFESATTDLWSAVAP